MTERVVQLAKQLKEEYKTDDPYELCRCLGITLVRTDLPDSIDGFYMEQGGRQAIVIKAALESPFDIACAAHELGHAVLHKGMNTIYLSDRTPSVTSKYEREADLFAAVLLLDGSQNHSHFTAAETAVAMGLSPAAVRRFLKGSVKAQKCAKSGSVT